MKEGQTISQLRPQCRRRLGFRTFNDLKQHVPPFSTLAHESKLKTFSLYNTEPQAILLVEKIAGTKSLSH